MGILGSFSRPKSSLRAVADIGSHSIKLLVFETRPSGTAAYPFKKMRAKFPSRFEPERVALKFREILFSLVRELKKVPEEITVGLGPALAELSLPVWSAKLAAGKTARPQDYHTLFQNLFEEHRDSSAALLPFLLEVRINGYHLDKPREMAAAPRGEISFRALNLSFSPSIGAILADAKRALGGMPVEFVPLAAVESQAIRDLMKLEDFFWLDLGGEHTICGLVKEGVLSQIAAFPLGAHHFARGIAKISGISFEEAEDLKRQYVQGITGEAKKKELREFLTEESKLWEKGFWEALDSFYHIGPIPERVFLFGGGANLTEIREILHKSDWIRERSPAERPEVLVLGAERFFEGSTLGGFLRGPEEVGLAALIKYSLRYERPF